MLTALLNGTLGTLLVAWIGTQVLGFAIARCLWMSLASNIAGLACTLVTTRMEASPWIKQKVLAGALRTWLVFLAVYFGTVTLLIPEIRDGRAFGWLVLPLILCTGYCIPVYGPIQDFFVRRAQRKQRAPRPFGKDTPTDL